jgi:hypothetical protein
LLDDFLLFFIAQSLSKHCDFQIVLKEDFYIKYWKAPDGSAYVSQINNN